MEKPKPLKIGPAFLKDKINEIIEYTHKTRPVNGNNTTVDDGPDGRPINANGAGGTGGGGSVINVTNPPFDPTTINDTIAGLQETITSMQETITALTGSVTTLQNRLDSATGSGTCTGDEITISLNFPG